MPTYDYKCPECGEVFEKFHGINEEPQISCPSCNTIATKQIGMGAGIVYKGSGFYTTDYKKPAAQATKQQEAKASSAPCANGGSCGCA